MGRLLTRSTDGTPALRIGSARLRVTPNWAQGCAAGHFRQTPLRDTMRERILPWKHGQGTEHAQEANYAAKTDR